MEDFIVIGSGFGGAVCAARLSQKGYSVNILEMGKEWKNQDFPKTNWHVFKYLWAPFFRCFGIQKITFLKKLMVLSGVGVGGGSLVYANTLMQPQEEIFASKDWPAAIDWYRELSSHYATAKKMLGVVTNKTIYAGEEALKELGETMEISSTFHATEVGVYFGEPLKEVDDPYFEGEGPRRVGCHHCGACMIGCPSGAKNTLDKNYLHFAKKWGAKIFAQTKVTKIIPLAQGGYEVRVHDPTAIIRKKRRSFKAKNVILSAGALGSVELLLKNKYHYKTLTKISDFLGQKVRTNGESLLGASSLASDKDYSQGIAIGAAIHPDKETKIENVRYPAGSDLLRFLALPLTPAGSRLTRPLKLILELIRQFPKFLRLYTIRDWAKHTVILLVMQSKDNHMSLGLSPFFKKLTGRYSHANRVPSYIPVAQDAAKKLSTLMDRGVAQNIFSEVVFDAPATAHILGGAILGEGPQSGVVNSQHEVFGHPGLYVCDGSVIPANLAVNPSLTITALAERFCEQFAGK